MNKKRKRILVYSLIISFFGVAAISFFTVSQYEKAKYKASEQVRLSSESKLNTLSEGTELYTYWDSINKDFINISSENKNRYIATAVPSYIFSIMTLVSFGLILKHADKEKEKEDKEVILS